ncbi:hypothetical protein [Sphingomonas sp. 179-A 4D3 NHS]|uniref:hypothetical protein n=1 Tax=Sphingomonas sp. 179-A 4D3 NHS TaxID=3374291 RepID=UPI00387994AA
MPKLVMHIDDRIEMLEREYRAWERLYDRRQEAKDAINWNLMTPADRRAAEAYDERIIEDGAFIWCELDHVRHCHIEQLW